MANSPEVSRNTGSSPVLPGVLATSLPTGPAERNVLHQYRTFNYLFTLGSLPSSALNDSKSVRENSERFVIARSGGKGTSGISPKVADAEQQELIDRFNLFSPGRFDLYMNNVEIETLMAFSNQTNLAMATKLSFDILEPYSISGFYEAMQVAAISAGHESYMNSPFILKMEFAGYTDTAGPSEVLKNAGDQATRYFVIIITKIEVEVNENGTKYKCSAIAHSELGYGNSNVLKDSIQMRGETVGEILQSFMKGVTAGSKTSWEQECTDTTLKDYYDEYTIVFPIPKPDGTYDYGTNTAPAMNPEIADKLIKNLSILPSIYSWPAPGTVKFDSYNKSFQAGAGRGFVNPPLIGSSTRKYTQAELALIADQAARTGNSSAAPPTTPQRKYTQAELEIIAEQARRTGNSSSSPSYNNSTSGTADPPKTYAYDNKNSSVMFTAKAKIHDIISAVIRDSEYGRAIFEASDPSKFIKDQFIDYMHVAIEIEEKYSWNKFTGRQVNRYRYVVLPYKMHYSRIPLFQKYMKQPEQQQLELYCKRRYEYLYMGQNVDIRSFNLRFNNLFFQAYPKGLNGAFDNSPYNDKKQGEDINGKALKPIAENKTLTIPLGPRMHNPAAANVVGVGGNSGTRVYDTYDALAKNMHQAILDNTDMITCELEILGDPYFLCTGGIGSYRPTLADKTSTENGEAPYQTSDVIVLIQFRNPDDIAPFAAGGLAKFDKSKIPFSGCFRVIKVQSKFSDGVFTQRLNLVRLPGQWLGTPPKGQPVSDSAAPQDTQYAFLEDRVVSWSDQGA